MAERDIKDWTIVALALSLNCPIWTEDQDFFGIGIAVWNTRNIEIYLSSN
jgi:predicted nucleic acid-binding protein